MINAQEWINAQMRWRQYTEHARPIDALIALMIAAVLLAMILRPQDRAVLGYPLAVLFGLFAARRALSASRYIDRAPGASRSSRRNAPPWQPRSATVSLRASSPQGRHRAAHDGI